MKQNGFIGFDTSNYTTSIAVCDEDGNITANLKKMLPVSKGERGLRQSDALFCHTKNMPELSDCLAEAIKDINPLAIGCSAKPRNIEGSYMPCFLAGIAAAHSFGAGVRVPIYEFSHQEGHIKAAEYSSGADVKGGDFIAFHVSGGTTEILLVKHNSSNYQINLIGGSRDLNAGQCIDRAGVMMGLKFPCGAEMDKLAINATQKSKSARVSVDGLYCNFSGVENMASRLWKESNDIALVSDFVIDYIGNTLFKLTENIYAVYQDIPIIYAGGVMSSECIRKKLQGKGRFFAKPEYSSDNAAGIVLLCREKYKIWNKT